MGEIGPNVPKLGIIGRNDRLCQGLGQIWRNSNLQNLLKHVNPWFQVGMLLELVFNLADASP